MITMCIRGTLFSNFIYDNDVTPYFQISFTITMCIR